MSEHGVILFHTTSAVMRAEKLLLGRGYAIKLIPTPREFSSDCGIAIRFEAGKSQEIKSLLTEEKVVFAAIQVLRQPRH